MRRNQYISLNSGWVFKRDDLDFIKAWSKTARRNPNQIIRTSATSAVVYAKFGRSKLLLYILREGKEDSVETRWSVFSSNWSPIITCETYKGLHKELTKIIDGLA